MQRLALKDRPGNGFTYQLEATKNGYYRNVRNNEMVYLKAGDVWKYGETTQGEKRYSKLQLENENLYMRPIFHGSKTEILIYEKKMLIEYYYRHNELPPGNKIFK